jgi:hypothetical protein
VCPEVIRFPGWIPGGGCRNVLPMSLLDCIESVKQAVLNELSGQL